MKKNVSFKGGPEANIEYRNIAKGTTDPGVDCFDQ